MLNSRNQISNWPSENEPIPIHVIEISCEEVEQFLLKYQNDEGIETQMETNFDSLTNSLNYKKGNGMFLN